MLVKKDTLGIMHYVKDLEAASQWYRDNLGFSIGDYDFNEFVELTVEGQYVMHLFKSLDSRPAEKAYFVLGTDDIENTYHTLRQRKVDLRPLRHYGDHAGFTLKDCDGNVLMICQYFN
ncbi:VOC family protein [Paenibacillus ginsengarvi]|uniref:VOC family protein n=1 Tax=Paenibacillus ginsengarvi TaxID=400777 RepID=A0A3B0CHX6_9BACL|nr:VOC family protein [Paenibacillus ginsengarvi]RKN84338.1 VOC family protein [Paenibacillus ginsengarvi]